MATLTNAELRTVFNRFMRAERETLNTNSDLEKPDLEAIFLAARTFLQDHQGIYNSTIPNPPRAQATLALKAIALGYVAIGLGDKEAGRL